MLNIVLDDELYETLRISNRGIFYLFIESFADGNLTSDLFSHSFIKNRSDLYGISTREYEKYILSSLKPLFGHKYTQLYIYMSYGMNQALSLLLILAYLDQIEDTKEITIYCYDQKAKLNATYRIKAKGYNHVYQTLFFKKQKPKEILITPIQMEIEHVLEYKKENNSLLQFLKENQDFNSQLLYAKFMEKFSDYQLTDQQFIHLLRRSKKM